MSKSWNRKYKNSPAIYRRDWAWDLDEEQIVLTHRLWYSESERVPKSNYAYRKDPVPSTGKRYWGGSGSYFRNITTYAEKRDNEGCIADGHINLVRAKRNKRNLVDSWDDICHSRSRYAKCWKYQSKKRYQWER